MCSRELRFPEALAVHEISVAHLGFSVDQELFLRVQIDAAGAVLDEFDREKKLTHIDFWR